jgi:luciferase family oxidoreductase group 1
VAEHHNIPGVASAATSVLIGHLAGGTSSIRVGSGGIMLPNHAPLVIAEQFGTLESLFPGRIDLGLGRAPGGDQRTARALRRGLGTSGDTFPQDLAELLSYFGGDGPSTVTGVTAIPGAGLNVPVYLLGSSDFSARLAAELGLPFAFASHFAPEFLYAAIELYRSLFEPSPRLARPHVMVGVNVFAADTDAEAQRLFTSIQQMFLGMIRGNRQQLPPRSTRWTRSGRPPNACRPAACSAARPSGRPRPYAGNWRPSCNRPRPTSSSSPPQFTTTAPRPFTGDHGRRLSAADPNARGLIAVQDCANEFRTMPAALRPDAMDLALAGNALRRREICLGDAGDDVGEVRAVDGGRGLVGKHLQRLEREYASGLVAPGRFGHEADAGDARVEWEADKTLVVVGLADRARPRAGGVAHLHAERLHERLGHERAIALLRVRAGHPLFVGQVAIEDDPHAGDADGLGPREFEGGAGLAFPRVRRAIDVTVDPVEQRVEARPAAL